ncbi:rRNA-processing protein UTP23 homolog [Phlebotomus argentipes]|uniref:rRNA-processing protein UTP23 homolog n=1 Tax=Phlebotomus argentipes TaxID=94469 RepID=UPI002892CC5D|nr:rRNA-processing protein UTP23 homolog [Phlebotomus argentipes]
MKVKRRNKLLKYLDFYKLNYGFRQPYQVLVDATFCHHALSKKIKINDQIKNYLGAEVKFITTRCCIMETESLGATFSKTTFVLKSFAVHKCNHDSEKISGSACIKSLAPQSHYIVATQDKSLQKWCRRRPGQPLLYFHGVTPVFEAPSDTTKASINEQLERQLNDLGTLKVEPKEVQKIKKKRKKNPNPLSCLKKKKKPNQEQLINTENNNKRKRIKIPQHVKEHLRKTS